METKNFKLFRTLLERGISREKIRYANLRSADLRYANLSYANLRSADLRYANLSYADLRYADLSSANLSSADLRYADLRYANLSYADLSSADLRYADLRSANLSSANLRYADLRSANLSSANLRYAEHNEYTYCFCINCPEEGEFIAYKKCHGKIVKLLILEDSKRSSATSLKCRASKTKTLEIEDGLTEISSDYDSKFIYKVGEINEVTDFDDNRWNECSNGIHFFMNKEMAKQYSN